jgi:hypothetical protein
VRCGAVPLALLVLGCSSQPTPSAVTPQQPDPCRLAAPSPDELDTFTVALLEPVDWRSSDHALSSANDSERLLFRNLFPNVIQLDCQGTVRPGLAEAWSFDPNTGWTFTVREQTADIVAAILDSAVILDPRHVRLPVRGRDSVPRFLADPALTAATGMASPGTEPGGIELRAAKGTPVYFKFEAKNDPRDVLDRGADLVVTRDVALVEYVANRADLATFTLPWSRTYVLAETGLNQGALTRELSGGSVRTSLAKDAVRADARAAEPPYWWSEAEGCGSDSTLPRRITSPRVVYRNDDGVARSLAERTVALAPATAGLHAVGLDAREFATAVADGLERAYVIGLPRHSLAPCRDASRLPSGARLVPLIDTRAYAIVRKGAPPLRVEWDGTLRIIEP